MHADGKDSLSHAGIVHKITAEIRPSYNIPTHHFYRGINPSGKAIGPVTSYHLKYSFAIPAVYQGIGLAVNDFYQRDIIGSPAAIYIFQGVRLLNLSRSWSFGYEWNLGLSYGWKETDVIKSRSNIYINVALPFTWKPASGWEVQAGPEYTHFSNGDTCYPNGGSNLIGFRLGVSRVFGNKDTGSIGKEMFSKEESLKDAPYKDRISYDILLYGAWRSGRILDGYRLYLINRPFPLAGISINPLYCLNRYFHIGPSLDIQADRSTGLHTPVLEEDSETLAGYSTPELWEQTALGLSIRGELEMPFFTINIGAGYNVFKKGEDVLRFYTTYNLKTFITKRIYLNIGYRLSAAQYTHNLMLGFGFRL